MAFASIDSLRTRLGRPLADDDQAADILAVATAHLQEAIGAQVSPPATVTVAFRLSGKTFIPAPMHPCTVDAVVVDGAAVPLADLEIFDGGVMVGCGRKAEITYTAGYAQPPAALVDWCIVLAAQALTMIEETGTAGGISSVAIDDYRLAWDPSFNPGGGIPTRVVDMLRSTYGQSAYVTSSR